MALAKLEGLVRFTSAQTVTVVEDGVSRGPITVLSPDTDYFWTSATAALTTIAAALNAGAPVGVTWALAIDDTADNATGRTTISVDGLGAPAPTVTFNTTPLRDYLGFTGVVAFGTGNVPQTSTNHARFLWLPDVKRTNQLVPDGDAGLRLSDATFTVAPSGHSKSLVYNERFIDNLEFQQVLGRKAWDRHETYGNESFEQFWQDVIKAGLPFKYHAARSDDATFVTYKARAAGQLPITFKFPGWDGAAALFDIKMDVIKGV